MHLKSLTLIVIDRRVRLFFSLFWVKEMVIKFSFHVLDPKRAPQSRDLHLSYTNHKPQKPGFLVGVA
jgi:hypothetical protein